MEIYFFFSLVANIFAMSLDEGNSIDPDNDVIDLSYLGTKIYGSPKTEVGDIVSGLEHSDDRNNINPEELGSYAEGDILIPRPLTRNGMLAETFRWPGGIVPYEIKGNYNANELSLIKEAINSYNKNTCIKFVPHQPSDQDYITIQNSQSGCWSSVGRVGGPQIVNLQSPGCVYKVGTVIHELMHALGFLHEQNREDRDDHIIIQMENIRKGTEVNFEKAPKGSTTAFGVDYDYGSVMHYSAAAFSINGKPTIVAKRKTNAVMGQRDGFSPLDLQKIWKMYKCKATPGNSIKPIGSSSLESVPSLVDGIIGSVFPNEAEKKTTSKK